MKAHPVLLQRKYARLIMLISKRLDISLGEALDKFIFSKTYFLMRNGIGDSHCLSDEYLLEDFLKEEKLKYSL